MVTEGSSLTRVPEVENPEYLQRHVTKIVIGVTIAMSLATLHENVRMLRSWTPPKTTHLEMPAQQEKNMSLAGNNVIIMLLSSSVIRINRLPKMVMSSMILRWIT